MNHVRHTSSQDMGLVLNANKGAFMGMFKLTSTWLLKAFSALQMQPEQVQYIHSPLGFVLV